MAETIEAGVKIRQSNAVVFASESTGLATLLVSQTLQKFTATGTVGSVCIENVADFQPGASAAQHADIFIFLLDRQHTASPACTKAVCAAMQRAVAGKALIVPVVVDPGLCFENSLLAFLSPVAMDTQPAIAPALASLDALVRDFISSTGDVPSGLTEEQRMLQKVSGVTQIAEVVDPLPCHMRAYDDFVEQLIGRLQVMRMAERKGNLNMFSEALRQVLSADMVYCYYRSKSGELHLFEAESNRKLHECTAAAVHSVVEDALARYAQNLGKRSLRLQNFLPQLADASNEHHECMVIVNERLPDCGVFIASRHGFSRYPQTEVISLVVNTVHDALAWSKFENFDKLKARVYDVLKGTYRFVSDDMYEDRKRIFRNQLSGLSVQFEPMFRFDRHARSVDIWAYEALAREHAGASSAPVEIFNTADLWGMGFQSEVDTTLLNITLSAYSEQISELSLAEHQIKPLSLNVYPATLRSPGYRELLYTTLARCLPLRGHHLIMEVSEKTVVSPELNSEARKELEEYRKLVRQLGELTGVRFAIDDFGVGNASLSRLDSLRPHYVKIDRDILSFDKRMADTLIRYLLESQRERGTGVILEGVDIHSKLSLDCLVNEIGVEIIQGHRLSKSVTGFSPGWEKETTDKVMSQLGWSGATESAANPALVH